MDNKIWHQICTLYNAEKRFVKLKNSPQLKILADSQKQHIERKKSKLKEMGVDEEAYKRIIDKHWMKIESIDLMCERMGKCLYHIKWLQKKLYKDEDIANPCADKNCFDCNKYKEITEEQESNYLHGRGIDTGEVLPGID